MFPLTTVLFQYIHKNAPEPDHCLYHAVSIPAFPLIIIINLIYISQFDTNGILTALYIVMKYIQMQYVHMNINEAISFIHIHMPTHKDMHRHMYKYISTDILTSCIKYILCSYLKTLYCLFCVVFACGRSILATIL